MPELKAEIIASVELTGADSPLLPLFESPVAAGFPSPADDFIERRLNLHSHLIRNESSTFFLRASGYSMKDAGILDGDLLIVDRSLPADHNRVIIAAFEGDLTVKRLVRRKNRVFLAPANPDYPEIEITNCEYLHVWGVVTYAVHKV